MSSPPDALVELAHAYGVATDYRDWRGRPVEVPEETLTAVLAAMDVDSSDPSEALRAHRETPWRRLLPACVVVRQQESRRFGVHLPHGEAVRVTVDLETGGAALEVPQADVWVEPREVDGGLVGEVTFEVPRDLPLGYHRLHARTGDLQASCPLIVTPDWLGFPERMGSGRSWGLAVQLYSVRSRRSWGVGDLVDLADLSVWAGSRLGADFVLVNPLHAAEPVAPMEPSPYLPSSRRFFNPLYLRVDRVPEYADLPAADRAACEELAAGLHRDLDGADTIDRDTSWTAKRAALELLFRVPRSAGRALDLAAFLAREGRALDDVAAWNALAERHGNDFRSWPEALRSPRSEAVAAFVREHAEAVDFHRWLQWLLDEQLQLAQGKARGAGMLLGTLHDLAVGVHPGGADVWRLQDTYATSVQVGAPPDPFNQVGQDWSQPPWRPDRLEELGYAPLRELLHTVLRHAGGVRVDHIIGFFRLWWIPEGQPPSGGTYVRYDHEAMLGVLALEAHRAGALVVGEDLGVVEPSARDYLRGRGILGTSILWFERGDDAEPLPAERWREYCLASVTTHDLPPTAGYLDGEHVRLRDRLGLLTRPLAEEVAADDAERESWLAELRHRGLLPEHADERQTVEALHRYLTLTPSRLLGVALTDAVGDRRTQNQPGTTDEYPNWRVPLSDPAGRPMLLEDVFTSARAEALARLVAEQPQQP